MLRIVLFYVVPLVLCIYCVVAAITSKDDEIRHLPKILWILLILFFPVIGSIAWLVAGRPVRVAPHRPHERPAPEFPEYDRPGRRAASDPAADAEFLRKVRARAEQQRRRAEQQRREREASESEDGEADPA